MKLVCLYCLLAGGFCQSSKDYKTIYARPYMMASLPCPEKTGDVTWSYLENDNKQTLVTIVNGQEQIYVKDKYGSQVDNTLLIKRAVASDSRMYFCNKRKVYLEVTTDPDKLDSQNTANPDEVDSNGSGLKEDSDKEESDSENHRSSDLWKVPVGVVIGAVSVLLVLLTLRFCSKWRAEKNTSVDKTPAEVIYEEINSVEDQPRTGSDVESPYWSSVALTPNTSTPTNYNLYSTVNKPEDPSREECVYYLAQQPAQTEGDDKD